MLTVYDALNVVARAALSFFAQGRSGFIPTARCLVIVVSVAFEDAYVVCTTLHHELAALKRIGRLSGYGLSVGSLSGLAIVFTVG